MKKLLIGTGILLLVITVGYLALQKTNSCIEHTDYSNPKLVLQTGLKLYDNISLFSKRLVDDSNYPQSRNKEGEQLRNELKIKPYHKCYENKNTLNQTISYNCSNITGHYYNFDVAPWGLRINYHEDHLRHYHSKDHILPPPNLETRYLSGSTLYGDNVFMLTFYPTGSKEHFIAPEIIHYKDKKFYPIEADTPFHDYKTINNNGETYGRLFFFTHPNKEYYYTIFQELKDCGPFCGIDHHRFQFFLK
ncbi:MAG: hypothetical protein DLD55_04070 [candidate division SR1 bacterium]|nr:MAG: hypothetical protein DLD55_04070 [candidate division SR1 bacterium]